MVIPIRDDLPTMSKPILTIAIIAACIYIYGFVQPHGADREVEFLAQHAAIPCEVVHAKPISNELSQASLLVCPSDTKRNRSQYTDWSAVAQYGSSYQYSGSRASETRPQEIVLRCPIHNNAGLADGSTQQLSPSTRNR